MHTVVSMISALALMISTTIAGVPVGVSAADSTQVPTARWSHTIATHEAAIEVYPPQAVAWNEHRSLEARVAVGVTKKGVQKPVLGTLEVTADTQTDFDTRTVIISNWQVRSSRFPSLGTEQAAGTEQLVRRAMADEPPERVPLDTVLPSLKEQGHEGKAVDLKHDPPVIYYSAKPADLVVFDGEPVMTAVQGASLLFAGESSGESHAVASAGGVERSACDGIDGGPQPVESGPFRPHARLPAPAGFRRLAQQWTERP
jgi:hypothetical protein